MNLAYAIRERACGSAGLHTRLRMALMARLKQHEVVEANLVILKTE